MPNRNVSTEVWNDPKFTDDFTAEDKYFWLFLLTSKYGNLSGCFEITYKQIARDMGYSKETAQNLIYRFAEVHRMITYDNDTNELLIHNWYKYNWTKSPKMETVIYKFINKVKSDFLRNMLIEMYENYKSGDRVSIGYQYPSNTIPNTKSIPITVIDNKDKELKEVIKHIVDYFNKKVGTKYRHTTKAINEGISARLKEGFTIEDCIKVIDVKYDDWIDDKEMVKHLNLITLFRPSNFEKYLNQKGKKNRYKSLEDNDW